MDFWNTLWATLWGALAGALVGALAAWIFALDLRRRQAQSEYDDKLNASISAVSSAVRLVVRTKRSSAWRRMRTFSRNRTIIDEEIVINATDEAMMIANSEDIAVLRMFEARMELWLKGLTLEGRVNQFYAALHARGLTTNEHVRRWVKGRSFWLVAYSFWSSWERTPLDSVAVLLDWRRGAVSRAEAIRLLDPEVFPVYDFDTGDKLEDWSGALRYGLWAPKRIRAQYRSRERTGPIRGVGQLFSTPRGERG